MCGCTEHQLEFPYSIGILTRFLCTEHIPSSRCGVWGISLPSTLFNRGTELLYYVWSKKDLGIPLCMGYRVPVQYLVLSVWFAIHPSNIRGASGMRNGISLHCIAGILRLQSVLVVKMAWIISLPISRIPLQTGTCGIANGIIILG